MWNRFETWSVLPNYFCYNRYDNWNSIYNRISNFKFYILNVKFGCRAHIINTCLVLFSTKVEFEYIGKLMFVIIMLIDIFCTMNKCIVSVAASGCTQTFWGSVCLHLLFVPAVSSEKDPLFPLTCTDNMHHNNPWQPMEERFL